MQNKLERAKLDKDSYGKTSAYLRVHLEARCAEGVNKKRGKKGEEIVSQRNTVRKM